MPGAKNSAILALADLVNGQEADVFALMTTKDELTTRDGKPYFRVGFRDARREVQFPIWADSPWAVDCRGAWTPGTFYKLRAVYRDTNYGPQLELRKVRATTDADAADGFDPMMLLPRSRFDPAAMYAELTALAADHIVDAGLRALVLDLLTRHREQLLVWTAARHNHHAFIGGFLEHTLSVTRTCVYLAQKYDDYYPNLQPRLDQGLVVAGAILHDIGKLRELEQTAAGPVYGPEGHLIGHILQGRDMVREAAAGQDIDRETLLRLEHVIVAHQRLPEWGSPKPPMTPEALIVHYADDLDAKYHMLFSILETDTNPGPFTSRKNILGTEIFRGLS
ncbi:MAG: HD domain-containing protein [Pirellulales bacterium]